MTKTEVQKVIEEVFAAYKPSKLSEEIKIDLLSRFAANVSQSEHPPVLDDEGNIIEAWCKFHKRYEIIDNIVLSNGKSKGYCKAGLSEWNKRLNKAKAYDVEAIECLTNGDTEAAIQVASSAKSAREYAADYSTYDFDADWANFKAKK